MPKEEDNFLNKNDYFPTMAMIVYENRDTDYYVETREFIKNDFKEYRMGPGQPATKKSLAGLARLASKKKDTSLESDGVISARLLFIKVNDSELSAMWFIPAGSHKIHFAKNAEIKTGSYHLPNLIMGFKNQKISVFAVKDSYDKIIENGDSNLFRAPFLNIYINGDVCMGNNTVKERHNDINDLINDVQHKFFGSKFTHVIEKESIKGGIIEYFNKVDSKTKFDNELLLPIKKRLSSVW